MKNIIITTTNTIEGASIDRYLGVVSTNIVLGTNIISDFTASFSDFFGGYSETYQNKLQLIYKEAMKDLTQKATLLGANCILGFRIDFDEISGKGKSMFMVSALGTAAQITSHIKNNDDSSPSIITAEILQNKFKRGKLIEKIKEGEKPSQEDWDFLMFNPISEIAEDLLNQYLDVVSVTNDMLGERGIMSKNFYPKYISNLDRDFVINLLYDKLKCIDKDAIVELIKMNNLFSSAKIIDLLDLGKLSLVIALLSSSKISYDKDDLKLLNELIERLDNLPDTGKYEIIKGILSKGDEKYICVNGHKNDKEVLFCNSCGVNVKGLRSYEVEAINDFRLKVNILNNIF